MGPIYVPPAIWSAIGSWGGTLAADERAWAFPLEMYEPVLKRLDELGDVERIPPWAFQMIDAARSHGEELKEERLPEKLLPYQLEGVRFGVGHGGRCLIGDEMGLGKTVQALALAAQYTEDWPVLVVCPASLRWVWKEHIQQWLPGLVRCEELQIIKRGSDALGPQAMFWILSFGLFAADLKNNRFQQRPDGSPHRFVIVDESHCVKDWGSARTKAVVPLLRKSKRAVLLSGTPMRNSSDELHPQLCALIPKMTAKCAEFKARYSCQQHQQAFGGRVVSKVVGARNAVELNHLLTSTVMIRRLKQDVLEQLPPKRRQRVPIEISDAKLMREIRAQMQAYHEDETKGEMNMPKIFMSLARAKLPVVREYLQDVLERADDKVIVFAHHEIMIEGISEVLAKILQKDGLVHVVIDGKTPTWRRPELVKRFQEDPACRIALLSITACGEGHTMTAAGHVIFAELYWVPGALEQAEARAHRIGSAHQRVVVEFLVVPDSPDELIYHSLERKKKDTSHVLDGAPESLGATERTPQEKRKRPAPEPPPEESPPPVSRSKAASLFQMVKTARRALI